MNTIIVEHRFSFTGNQDGELYILLRTIRNIHEKADILSQLYTMGTENIRLKLSKDAIAVSTTVGKSFKVSGTQRV